MKEIVIAQPLGVSKETLSTLLAPLTGRGYHLTLWDSLPENQDDLGNHISKADLAVIANYPLKKEALDKASSLKYLCVAFTGVCLQLCLLPYFREKLLKKFYGCMQAHEEEYSSGSIKQLK